MPPLETPAWINRTVGPPDFFGDWVLGRRPIGATDNAISTVPQSLSLTLAHLVFSTKDRMPFLTPDIRADLHA
ncbi:MAG: hypothetical protein CFE26_01450 [Verrucomicrobiales bacterium VVV1]|nr:MAG: hypothetical protein CFE26_01450 [Verrucomicrobiales bacterium VVV1]